jgi:hypothetical protein
MTTTKRIGWIGVGLCVPNILEVDGKFKSEYETSAAAMKVGLELKTKYPHIQVKVYDAKERSRTAIELS